MELFKAQTLTAELITILKPYSRRIEVAGSVRRQCKEVNDIDIVLIQHPFYLGQFFLNQAKHHFIEIKDKLNPQLKWGPKYKQIRYKGNKIELWIADKENWGLVFAIRTGSAEFSAKLLANWKKVSNGGESDKGYLRDSSGKKINIYEEAELFNLCEMEWVEPKHRSLAK